MVAARIRAAGADEAGHIKDLTMGDPYYYTSDQSIGEDDGQKELVDVKFFANLDGQAWNNPTKYLANAGHGQQEVTYTVEPGEYGVYTDPCLTGKGERNPRAMDLDGELTLKYPAVEEPVTPVE